MLSVLLESRLEARISPVTLNRWVDQAGEQAKTPLEVSAELRPRWGGVLGVDGKKLWLAGGRTGCLLIAVDQATQDIVHALVLDAETAEGFRRVVHESVVEAAYPLVGLVIDDATGWLATWRDFFPRAPLQLCRVHFDRRLDQDIPKWTRRGEQRVALHAEFKQRLRELLYSPGYDHACRLYYALVADRARYQRIGRRDVLANLTAKFNLYFTHHQLEGMPADTNRTENVIRQLGRKLRLMESFASIESAERFSRLLIGCYRFKRFTDSNHRGHNGRSPLEIAGIDITGRDWLTFHLTREQHTK